MRYYYNPIDDQYAKVLSVDGRTGIAEVVIDDKHQPPARGRQGRRGGKAIPEWHALGLAQIP